MSEYWVSKQKYFCKYCNIYNADDVPSRRQHEQGLRHQGNVERFIRNIYKTKEKQEKDGAQEQRDLIMIHQAAQAAFAKDVQLGNAKYAAPVASSSSTPAKKPVAKPSNPYANYSTAASLGFTDPDAANIEAAVALRQSQGVAGEWQVIDAQPPAPPSPTVHETADDGSEGVQGVLFHKREAEAPADDSIRAFKLRKKTLGARLGEIYDPGLIPIVLKKKEEEEGEGEGDIPPTPAPPTSCVDPELTEHPRWTSISLKKENTKEKMEPEDGKAANVAGDESTTTEHAPKEEPVANKWAKVQWAPAAEEFIKEEELAIKEDEPAHNITMEGMDVKLDEQNKSDLKSIKSEHSIISPEPMVSMFKKRKAPVRTGGRR